MSDDDKLVWSSEGGRAPRRTDPEKPRIPNDGIVRISRPVGGELDLLAHHEQFVLAVLLDRAGKVIVRGHAREL